MGRGFPNSGNLLNSGSGTASLPGRTILICAVPSHCTVWLTGPLDQEGPTTYREFLDAPRAQTSNKHFCEERPREA